MKLTLDLHTHSLQTTGAEGSLAEMIDAAQKRHLTGIAITDVDYFHIEKAKQNSDAQISENISFEQAVCVEQHFLLIPGIEFATEFGRVLGLFVEQRPHLPEYQRKGNGQWVFSQTVKAIHKAGGVAVLAQPGQAELSLEMWAEIDAWEAGNSHYQCLCNLQEPQQTEPLWCLWQKRPLPAIAGSDSYFPEEIGNAWTEITVTDKIWEYDYWRQLQLVREALLQEQPTIKGTRTHPYFIKRLAYNLNKIKGKRTQTPLLWLKKNIARRDYQKNRK